MPGDFVERLIHLVDQHRDCGITYEEIIKSLDLVRADLKKEMEKTG